MEQFFLQSAQPDGVLPHLRIQYHGLRFAFLFYGFVEQIQRHPAPQKQDLFWLRRVDL